ncbi:MAG: MFS transporter [Asticcacaulis sp.]
MDIASDRVTKGANLGAAAFYMATAIPMSCVFYLLPALLREEGHDATTIGLLSLVYLPYALRVIWAPLVDRYANGSARRYRQVMQVMLIGAVLAVAGFCLFDPATQLWGIVGIATLLFTLLATGTTGLDGFSITTFDARGRQRASIWQTVGFTLGGVVFALGMLLTAGLGWAALVLIIAAATALAALPLFFGRAPEAEPVSEPPVPEATRPETSLMAFLRQPAVLRLLLLSLLTKAGLGMVAGYLPVLQVDFGVSAAHAGFFGALGSNVLGLGAAFVSGLLMMKIGGLRTVGWVCLIAVPVFVFAALFQAGIRATPSAPLFAVAMSLTFLTLGYACVAPFKALSLLLSDGKAAASRAAILASVDLTLSILAASVSGALVTALSLSPFLWLSMALCLLSALVAFASPTLSK